MFYSKEQIDRANAVSLEDFLRSQGETLKIINDTINRECYMPGVAMACKKIGSRQGLVYGLDQILD